jgi:hypothetical protein
LAVSSTINTLKEYLDEQIMKDNRKSWRFLLQRERGTRDFIISMGKKEEKFG